MSKRIRNIHRKQSKRTRKSKKTTKKLVAKPRRAKTSARKAFKAAQKKVVLVAEIAVDKIQDLPFVSTHGSGGGRND